jgi:hypothetical protein
MTITLRFVSHPGLFNLACRIAQYGAPYTHCDALTPEGTYLGALLLGGVQERQKDYDAGKFAQEIFIHLKSSVNQESAFFSFLRSQVGKPYDPISILYFFGLFSSRNWHDPTAWNCSEYIAEGLEVCGLLPENQIIPSCRITPRDLFWITSSFEAIASGGINA